MNDTEYGMDQPNHAELTEEAKQARVNSAKTPEELHAVLEGFETIPDDKGQQHKGSDQAQRLDEVMKFTVHQTALVKTYGIRDKAIEFLKALHPEAKKQE